MLCGRLVCPNCLNCISVVGRNLKKIPLFNNLIALADKFSIINFFNQKSLDEVTHGFKLSSRLSPKGARIGHHSFLQLFEAVFKMTFRLIPVPDCAEKAFARTNQEIYVAINGASEFTMSGTLWDRDVTGKVDGNKYPTILIEG